jgi:hypothetical protein
MTGKKNRPAMTEILSGSRSPCHREVHDPGSLGKDGIEGGLQERLDGQRDEPAWNHAQDDRGDTDDQAVAQLAQVLGEGKRLVIHGAGLQRWRVGFPPTRDRAQRRVRRRVRQGFDGWRGFDSRAEDVVLVVLLADVACEALLHVVRGPLELAEAAAEGLGQLREATGAQDDQGDHEDEDQLGRADVEHAGIL